MSYFGKALCERNLMTFLHEVTESECVAGCIPRSEPLVGHVKEWEEATFL